MNNYLAHVREDNGEVQTVKEHLANTRGLANSFAAEPFKPLAGYAGMIHDIGKYRVGFQACDTLCNRQDSCIQPHKVYQYPPQALLSAVSTMSSFRRTRSTCHKQVSGIFDDYNIPQILSVLVIPFWA